MLGGIGTGSPISVLLRSVLNRPATADRGGGDAKAVGTSVPTASLGTTSPGASSPAAPAPLLSTASSLSLLTTEESTGLEGSIPGPEQKTSEALAEIFAEEGQAAHAKAAAMSVPAKGAAAPPADVGPPSEPERNSATDKSEDTPSAPSSTRSPTFHAADSARSSSTIAFDGADAPWRVMMMAIPIEGDAQVVRLLVREDGHNETATGTTSGRRFVVDTHLRRIGRTQIDGVLSSDARLSVTLRHERPLPEGVAAEIRETSSTLATRAGLTLSLNLRESPDDFVDLAPPQPAGHRVGMSI